MHPLQHPFDNNKRWASDMTSGDSHYFQRLSPYQNPEYLWIGCADSRMPANEVIGLGPVRCPCTEALPALSCIPARAACP